MSNHVEIGNRRAGEMNVFRPHRYEVTRWSGFLIASHYGMPWPAQADHGFV
jgi:hypothetical protein